MNWYIGCSGFHYKEWKEKFYPAGLPRSKWFDFYCSHFNTIELNVTFYRFPRVPFLENWYGKSPGNFLFAVKAPGVITHYKKFTDSKRLLGDFYHACRQGLKEKLGPVLFQLPPQLEYSKEKLEQIIDSMDRSFTNVMECRHASWWNKQVFTACKKNKLIFCGISYPHLPDDIVSTAKTIYYRFHGIPKLYYSSYKKSTLEKTADAIASTNAKDIFIYFNNTASLAAIRNAKYMKKAVSNELRATKL